MGLPCHAGEGEGVVVEDDAVMVLGVRGRACYAQAHDQNDEATIVFYEYLRAGCRDMRNLSASLARP